MGDVHHMQESGHHDDVHGRNEIKVECSVDFMKAWEFGAFHVNVMI